MPATFRCYQLKRSKDARKRCINLMSPKYSVIVAENRPRAIALGSKPPLVTRIARTGLGTRLAKNLAVNHLPLEALTWTANCKRDRKAVVMWHFAVCGLPFLTKNLMLKVPNMGNVSGKEGGKRGRGRGNDIFWRCCFCCESLSDVAYFPFTLWYGQLLTCRPWEQGV